MLAIWSVTIFSTNWHTIFLSKESRSDKFSNSSHIYRNDIHIVGNSRDYTKQQYLASPAVTVYPLKRLYWYWSGTCDPCDVAKLKQTISSDVKG